MDRLFKVAYFVGLVAEAFIRRPHEQRRRRMTGPGRRVAPTEHGLLVGLFIASFVLPLVYSLTSWLNFADYRLSPAAKARVGRVGAVLQAFAVWLFWRSHRDLGTNWSPSLEIVTQQTLTTKGVYGVIRHPMYASQWLWGTAQALLLPNWLAGFGGLVAFLPLYLVRVPKEERMMLDHFGDAYRAYSARTGRVLPRLRKQEA